MITAGYIFRFMDLSFKEIGLRWPATAYRNAYEKVFKNEVSIVCKWTVKLKDK